MKIHLQQKNKAFTLVETLVAISIFTMSILGLLMILSQGISDTGYAKKKITASYLAQEGIEYIRNMRDTEVLYSTTGNPWNNFRAKLASCNSGNGCGFIKPPPFDVFVCNNPNLCKLYINNGGYDTDSSGVDSGFIRQIWAETSVSDEIKIFSNVSWTQGSGNYNITFSEELFNWVE